jgi:hypothetical protein
MNSYRALPALALVIACYPALADEPSAAVPTFTLGGLDTNFESIKTPAGAWICGFDIRGNHRSHTDPHTEWDLHISEIRLGDTVAAGVSAATFVVSGHKRTPRAPITGLSFSIPKDPAQVPVDIRPMQTGDDSVRGEIALDDAHRLLTAMANDTNVTAELRYADQSVERLEIIVQSFIGMGKESVFERCNHGRLPWAAYKAPTP